MIIEPIELLKATILCSHDNDWHNCRNCPLMGVNYCKDVLVSLQNSFINKLTGTLTNDYERVTHCKDCLHYYSDVKFPYCCYHDLNVNEYDYCSKAKRKDEEE